MRYQAWIRISIAVIFAIGVFFQGYFQDWAVHAAAAALFAVAAVVYFVNPITRLSGLHLSVFIFVCLYGISILFAADTERAVIEAVRAAIWLPVVCLLLSLDAENNTKLQTAFIRIIAIMAAVGCLLGMERNERLESTIGYANALAMMLLVALCISIFRYAKNSRKVELIPSALFVAGLLLTMSRSVWVLWLLSAVVLMFMFPSLRRRTVMIHVGLVHLAGWLIAVAYKGNFLFLLDRAKTIEPGASEFQLRLVYWRDGWRMFQDYWLLGAGGGGWRLLQSEYQTTREYYVKFIHNHYMQLLLDVGALGTLAFMLVIALFGISLRKLRQTRHLEEREEGKLAGFIVILMLAHAGFDFDLTFPALAMLLLVFIASVAARYPAGNWKLPTSLKYILPTGFTAVFLFCAWLAIGYGLQHYAADLRDQGQFKSSVSYFRSANAMIPWSHTTHYEWAKTYVLIGNEEQDRTYYQLALHELGRALALQPNDKLYLQLHAEWRNSLK